MNNIYQAVADCRETFVEMSYTFTQDINEIEEAVQELMLYFMSMNPATLEDIYVKDGQKGLIRYGAVVLRRSFTSPRSPYYYKYKKYYTNLDTQASSITYDITEVNNEKNLYNIPNPDEYKQWQKLEQIDKALEDVYWYDRDVFKLYYYEGNTLTGLAKKTGISRNSLFTTIDKVREYLKEALDE
jgi:DNA-directed RNA polymerase specialized sigma24 family protein